MATAALRDGRQHCEMAAAAGSDGSNNDDSSGDGSGEGVRAS